LFVKVTQVYINKDVYLCNAILVTKIFCYRYSTFNKFSKKLYFLRNLAVASEFYWKLSIRNIVQIYSDLTFLLHDV